MTLQLARIQIVGPWAKAAGWPVQKCSDTCLWNMYTHHSHECENAPLTSELERDESPITYRCALMRWEARRKWNTRTNVCFPPRKQWHCFLSVIKSVQIKRLALFEITADATRCPTALRMNRQWLNNETIYLFETCCSRHILSTINCLIALSRKNGNVSP